MQNRKPDLDLTKFDCEKMKKSDQGEMVRNEMLHDFGFYFNPFAMKTLEVRKLFHMSLKLYWS